MSALTASPSQVELWCNSIPEVSAWAEAISQAIDPAIPLRPNTVWQVLSSHHVLFARRSDTWTRQARCAAQCSFHPPLSPQPAFWQAYHTAVLHDNVEAAYNDRMKGIQQVKQALQHERLVATNDGPVRRRAAVMLCMMCDSCLACTLILLVGRCQVLLTAPAPGDCPYANPYWRSPYGAHYGYQYPYFGASTVGLQAEQAPLPSPRATAH